MAHKSERVNRMINGFMEKHNEGLSIVEIANFFHVDFSTVYNCLQEIADNNNVTRESLLQVVKSSYCIERKTKNLTPKEPLDFEELLDLCDKIISEIKSMQTSIEEILN